MNCLNCKISYQAEVFSNVCFDKCINTFLALNSCQYEIYLAETVSNLDFNVNNILLKWKDKACISFSKEVNLLNAICFIINVLISLDQHLLKEWTDPSQEVLALPTKIRNVLITFLVHMHYCFYSESIGQTL